MKTPSRRPPTNPTKLSDADDEALAVTRDTEGDHEADQDEVEQIAAHRLTVSSRSGPSVHVFPRTSARLATVVGMPPTDGETVRRVSSRPLSATTDPDGAMRWHVIIHAAGSGAIWRPSSRRGGCARRSVTERMLGVDILGMLPAFADRTLPVLRYLAAGEDDAMVLYSVLIAFGHLADPRVAALGDRPGRRTPTPA